MPWKETVAVKERVKFLLEWEQRWDQGEGRLNFAALCREFGVSRQVGYEWLARYRAANHDLGVAKERSRRPLTTPSKVADELEDFIAAARRLHPRGRQRPRTRAGGTVSSPRHRSAPEGRPFRVRV
jgi:hypothetical protein